MLLCRDEGGPVYVKVGISDQPIKRLKSLRLGCPVTPHQFLYMEVRSRRKARSIEISLHDALAKWGAHGEWFRVPMEEKAQFNGAWKRVVDAQREPSTLSYEWQRISVAEFVRQMHANQAAKFKYFGKMTPAQRDALVAIRKDR